jgi:hypothetical protein
MKQGLKSGLNPCNVHYEIAKFNRSTQKFKIIWRVGKINRDHLSMKWTISLTSFSMPFATSLMGALHI